MTDLAQAFWLRCFSSIFRITSSQALPASTCTKVLLKSSPTAPVAPSFNGSSTGAQGDLNKSTNKPSLIYVGIDKTLIALLYKILNQ